MASSSSSSEIVSQRQKPKLIHEGYVYVFAQLSKDGQTEFWRCQYKNHVTMKCLARLHKNLATGAITVTRRHVDPADPTKIEIQVKKTELRRRAKETVESPQQIVARVRNNCSLAAQGAMESNKTLARIVQRTRKKLEMGPSHFSDLPSIIIPEEYRRYEATPGNFENFLLGDSGPEDINRIFIFGRSSARSWISQVSKLYVDGTFSLAPPLFTQVFVILGERPNCVIPLCYVLLPNKTEESYMKMLDMLCLGWPDLSPRAISMDFERALMNAFSVYFPEASIEGCFFHLVQNLKKHAASAGLTRRYRTDPDFALQARMISAIAFVPPERLEEALQDLRQELSEELFPILDYFEDTYMGRLKVSRDGKTTRRQPMFSVLMWSVYARTLRRESRTNNYVEAFHRTMQRQFAVDHPHLLNFIEGIRNVQHNKDAQLERYIAGQVSADRRNKYVMNDARILSMVEQVNNRTNIEFLRGIAHTLIMDV